MRSNDEIKLISIYFSGQVFGYRVGDGPYSWINYREADKTIQSFRRGLVKIGLAGYIGFSFTTNLTTILRASCVLLKSNLHQRNDMYFTTVRGKVQHGI